MTMMDALKIALFLILIAGWVWLIYKVVMDAYKRQELAKRNMSFIESIQLTGLPIISFKNGDTMVNMVLDTGSNVCLINSKILNTLHYELVESCEGVMGVGGNSDNGNLVNLPLSYKNMSFTLECMAVDMSDTMKSFKDEYGVNLHGLLGTGFFAKYKYILDFNEMVAYSLRKN